jgi:iron complex outermembrane recepter protein
MMKERGLPRSLRLMFSGGVAVGLGLLAHSVQAQETKTDDSPQQIQRVEITGSSIKRINKEGALPVQTLTQDDIAKTGATSVADLIQALPSMQGFVPQSSSVNGTGAGLETASIHGIGSGYTLVLLNGRRIARSQDAAVNLASIPLSAVERVEILTDGASALYGSDAIAGVVNFILKKNSTDLTVTGGYNSPLQSGGKSYNFGITKGFGDLDKDGYNVMLSYSHDEQANLTASQRGFADSGIVPFSVGGQQYSLYQLSSYTAPAGVTLKSNDGMGGTNVTQFSPNFLQSGKCGPNTFQAGQYCKFNYASTVELIPKSSRDSFVASGNFKLNSDTTLFGELVASRFKIDPQFAAAAQGLQLAPGSALYNKYITPNLAALGINPNDVTGATMNMRLLDAGGRQDEFKTDALHMAFGVDGSAYGWDYNASYTHSQNTWTDTTLGGYLSNNAFNNVVASGNFDPFAPPGTGAAALSPAVLHQILNKSTTKLDVLNLHASHDLLKLPAGTAQIGVGVEATREQYDQSPSAILMGQNALQPDYTDFLIGANSGQLPINASRKNYGAFTELLVPVAKNLDVTGALRYDSYDAAKNDSNFDASGNPLASTTQGNAASKATYKISARWQPVDSFLLRGSYGTGFKAPTLSQITQPQTPFGVTAGTYNCPFAAPDPRAVGCQGTTQYDLLQSGNGNTGSAGLKPETSTQSTIGFRLEPIRNLSIGFDLWRVNIKNQIVFLPEAVAFNNPSAYSQYFSVYNDPGTGPTVALLQSPLNLASATYQGIDWDHSFRTKTSIGDMSLQWTGTYMLKAEQNIPGNGIQSDIGKYGADQTVVFRVISRLAASWKQSDHWTHTLTANYRSGYHDQTYTADNAAVRIVNPDGSFGAFVAMPNHDVASYTTFDWQTKLTVKKGLEITAGIKNLFARTPPLSLINAGGGNQVGYDARYTDPLGRQLYLTGSYKF